MKSVNSDFGAKVLYISVSDKDKEKYLNFNEKKIEEESEVIKN